MTGLIGGLVPEAQPTATRGSLWLVWTTVGPRAAVDPTCCGTAARAREVHSWRASVLIFATEEPRPPRRAGAWVGDLSAGRAALHCGFPAARALVDYPCLKKSRRSRRGVCRVAGACPMRKNI